MVLSLSDHVIKSNSYKKSEMLYGMNCIRLCVLSNIKGKKTPHISKCIYDSRKNPDLVILQREGVIAVPLLYKGKQ